MLVTSNKMRSMLMSVQTLMNDIVRDSKGTTDAEFYRTVAEGVNQEARNILSEIHPDANLTVAPHLVSRWEALQVQYRSVVQQFNKDPETDLKRSAADIAYEALEAIGDSAKNALHLPQKLLSGAAQDLGEVLKDLLKALWPVLIVGGVVLAVVIVGKQKLS